MQFRTVRLKKDPTCPACGTHEIRELIDYEEFCGVPQAAAEAARDAEFETTPRDLAARLNAGAAIELIDVREPHEWEIARIEGARLIPLSGFTDALPTIDSAREIVVYCKVGARSARAVRQLRAAGFKRVKNLAGGIERWSEEVDPTIPRY